MSLTREVNSSLSFKKLVCPPHLPQKSTSDDPNLALRRGVDPNESLDDSSMRPATSAATDQKQQQSETADADAEGSGEDVGVGFVDDYMEERRQASSTESTSTSGREEEVRLHTVLLSPFRKR